MMTGLVLGVLTWLSMVFSFTHLPKKVKVFLLNHFMITDIISVLLSFLALCSISQSLGAVIGSITCGLLVNITLIVKKHLDASPQTQQANKGNPI
jgi:hypothetical protein